MSAIDTDTALGLPVVGSTRPRAQVEALWEQYSNAWADIPEAQRRQLLEQSTTPSVHYTDKFGSVTGYDALLAHIERLESSPFGRMTHRTNRMQLHRSCGQADYTIMDAEGKQDLWNGTIFVEWAVDGRFNKISVFF